MPDTVPRVYDVMGYIITIVVLVLVVPLLFMMLTRRSRSGGGIDSSDHGVTVLQPSSDQPTPPADRTSNSPQNKMPPG
jgi:hypothetical protein